MTFPFGHGTTTGIYLILYVVTLALHVVLLSYVLVGAGWLAVAGLRGRDDDPVSRTFRDWLPFALGAAITAGVAPLLFVQVLYQQRFYTANLLLSHRWMAVVPALIVGFYALYLGKTARAAAWPARRRAAVASLAALCFVFVAWSWTENHLLALRPEVWTSMYAAGRMVHLEAMQAPRLLLWLALAAPVAATVAGWQLAGDAAALRRLRVVALAGQVGALGAGAWLLALLPAAWRAPVEATEGVVWLALVVAGQLAATAGWLWAPRAPRRALALASAGLVVAILAGAVVRELIRWHASSPVPARVAAAGGMPVFLFFFVGNAVVITLLIRGARRHLTG
ncbi:MAG: hypothetical protein H6708_02515 [Kofleriaceae bacterium]|nr:hypothetical protein [Kofleriaceae bacterium]